MAFLLTCPSFADGGRIPVRHTCDGEDLSPPLHWANPPAGTESFAVICRDPDAPGKVWYHWAIFDIPASEMGLPEALPREPRVGAMRQAMNDFRRIGYGGPCPPRGHGAHRYRFELIALAVSALSLGDRCNCRAVEAAAGGHHLESVIIAGAYSRT